MRKLRPRQWVRVHHGDTLIFRSKEVERLGSYNLMKVTKVASKMGKNIIQYSGSNSSKKISLISKIVNA